MESHSNGTAAKDNNNKTRPALATKKTNVNSATKASPQLGPIGSDIKRGEQAVWLKELVEGEDKENAAPPSTPPKPNAKSGGKPTLAERNKVPIIGEKKRKADAAGLEKKEEEQYKENAPPLTPPKSKPEILEYNPNTPGRLGPIKKDDFSLRPNIESFKGPKGAKVRKTWQEKRDEYAQFARDNEGHCLHELYVCYDKGPDGSPTYDKSGFQLDYDKVKEWMKPRPYNKKKMMRSMDRALAKAQTEEEKMKAIFFEKGEAPEEHTHPFVTSAWKDRVSRDLQIPWHKVGVEEFEMWEKKGFKKARRGEYRFEDFTQEEKDRLSRLSSGCLLRK
jgi:hypothetical protein